MRTCNTSFNLVEAHSTFSFVLKQSARSIQDALHLLILQSFIAARQLAYGIEMKGSGPKQFNSDPDIAYISAFLLPWMPVWPGVQALVTSLSSSNIFRILMHVNTVLTFTILFWIAKIAASIH